MNPRLGRLCYAAMKQWRSQSFAERRTSMGLPPLEDEEGGSGDEMETEMDPPELVRARETLARYPARWADATCTVKLKKTAFKTAPSIFSMI